MENNLKLSKTMLEVIKKFQEHGKLKRYEGGFWSWEDVALKPLYNGGKFLCMVPEWYCDVKTLRALDKRGIVTLDEFQRVCILNRI